MSMIGAKASEEATAVIRYRANPPLDRAVSFAAARFQARACRSQFRAVARMCGYGVSTYQTAGESMRHLYRIPKGDACPTLSVTDHCDGVGIYTSNNGESMRRDALTKKSPYVDNLLACQPTTGVLFSPKVNKPFFPLVLSVSSKTDPLKVLNSIVKFVTVDVIDGQPIFVPCNKCDTNKPVNKAVHPYPVLPNVHLKISVPRFAGSCNRLLKVIGKCCHLPVPVFSGVHASMGWGFSPFRQRTQATSSLWPQLLSKLP